MRSSVLVTILACLAAGGCSTVSPTLSTDVWLCAYQLGDKYRDETIKPDIIKYDPIESGPIRRTTLTYLLASNEGEPPRRHTLTCEAAPWGLSVIAEDGFKLAEPMPSTYPTDADLTPAVQGATADRVRASVQQTGVHVHIPGVDSF